jgi:uncharacterized protein (TIGR02246 family)
MLRAMRFVALFVILVMSVLIAASANAAETDPATAIRAALTRWTEDFNSGHADKVCGLFAPDLRSEIRGAPERDYAALCDVLKKALNDPAQRFSYALEIKEIRVWGDVAMVRLTWTSKLERNGAVTVTKEPGMDIFARQPDGAWRITRFLAYEE